MSVEIFTDGACKGNPGRGGWGVLLRYKGHEKTLYGAEPNTTNNRMELTAAVKALEGLNKACVVDLYTDSQYLRKGMSEWLLNWKKNNWQNARKQPIKNRDLWQKLDELAAIHEVKWHWVKAHAGHIENEFVDELANKAILELLE